METSSSSLASIWEAAGPRSGVVGNPELAGGFLIGSSVLGLLLIIVAFLYNQRNLRLFKRSCIMSFTCQESRLMGVQLIYSCLVTLLFVDALNLVVAIFWGAKIVSFSCYDVIRCDYVESVWFLTRWFGVIIHLANASLCIYHLCYQPLSITRVRIIEILISVLIFIMIPLHLFVTKAAIFTLAAFMFLFALSIIVASRAPTSSPSTDALKKQIMVVAMCNFLVVYVPTFILQCLIYTTVYNYQNIYANILIFTNLQLIFDGFLCALFLKLPSGEEQQQQEQQELQQLQQTQQLDFQKDSLVLQMQINNEQNYVSAT